MKTFTLALLAAVASLTQGAPTAGMVERDPAPTTYSVTFFVQTNNQQCNLNTEVGNSYSTEASTPNYPCTLLQQPSQFAYNQAELNYNTDNCTTYVYASMKACNNGGSTTGVLQATNVCTQLSAASAAFKNVC